MRQDDQGAELFGDGRNFPPLCTQNSSSFLSSVPNNRTLCIAQIIIWLEILVNKSAYKKSWMKTKFPILVQHLGHWSWCCQNHISKGSGYHMESLHHRLPWFINRAQR